MSFCVKWRCSLMGEPYAPNPNPLQPCRVTNPTLTQYHAWLYSTVILTWVLFHFRGASGTFGSKRLWFRFLLRRCLCGSERQLGTRLLFFHRQQWFFNGWSHMPRAGLWTRDWLYRSQLHILHGCRNKLHRIREEDCRVSPNFNKSL